MMRLDDYGTYRQPASLLVQLYYSRMKYEYMNRMYGYPLYGRVKRTNASAAGGARGTRCQTHTCSAASPARYS